jgi:MFS family permease
VEVFVVRLFSGRPVRDVQGPVRPARLVGPVRPSFRDLRFALLLAGETVNSVGGWASAIVLWGFAAYRFNASPYAVAVTVMCWAAPAAALSPLMGVYVDRFGPKQALLAGYVAAAAASLGMAAAGSLVQLDVAAVAYGMTRALASPAAAALPPRIVASDDLVAANSLLGASGSAGQVVGPLVASAAMALFGFRAAFVLDAVSYLIGALVILPLPILPADEEQSPGWLHELRAGIALVGRRGPLRLVTLVLAAITFTSGAFLVVEPLYARHVLHRPPSQFALFEAAIGIGAILGGLAMARIGDRLGSRLGGWKILSAGAAGYGLAACVFAGTTSIAVAYAGAFAWGIAGALFYTVALTTLQRVAPVQAHGRVMGVTATIQSATDTIGQPLGGVTLAALGIRAGALSLAGVSVLAGACCFVTSFRRRAGGLPTERGSPPA